MRTETPRATRTSIAASAAILLATIMPHFVPIAMATDADADIADKIAAAFPDAPIMHAIAKCESGLRQFAADGTVLRGGASKGYIGIFQIGERLHAAPAAAEGHDIFTVDGNIAYARRLYDASGTNPWRECIPKGATLTAAPAVAVTPATPPPTTSSTLTANLMLGARGEQVKLLQQRLNATGFTIAATGPGSPGNETTAFGTLTRDAVRRFQCAKKIACDGNESSTGYGRVGPKTRALLP